MDMTEAKELLLLHSFGHSDINHPKMLTGFLGSLRPYRGLREENLHEVMRAVIALAPSLQKDKLVDREVIGALWAICDLARTWGVHPNGMLQSNNLISARDVVRLENWVDAISHATMVLLGGGDLEGALEAYTKNT
jgi:hypothetical protein